MGFEIEEDRFTDVRDQSGGDQSCDDVGEVHTNVHRDGGHDLGGVVVRQDVSVVEAGDRFDNPVAGDNPSFEDVVLGEVVDTIVGTFGLVLVEGHPIP